MAQRILHVLALMNKITKIVAREILDSRGNPTIEVDVYCGDVFGRVF